MAKSKNDAVCTANNWCPAWFGVLVLLVGIWLLLIDLGALPSVNVNWYSLFFVLWGIKLSLKNWCD